MSLNIKNGDTIQVIKNVVHPTTVPENPNVIKLKVMVSADSAIEFKTLRNDPLKKLMDVYCDRRNILRHNTKFILYDGVNIKDVDTPNSLNMNDDDIIDVVDMPGNYMKKQVRVTRWN
jgi:small ubiquitin-related modifier